MRTWRFDAGAVTQQAPFVRDAIHLRSLAVCQSLALAPCVAVVAYQGWGRGALATSGTQLLLVFLAGALWQRLQAPSFIVLNTEEGRALRIVDEVE